MGDKLNKKVAELSWLEVQEHIDAGALAVLPIGAASKEHGYHLPLNTDWLQAEWLADRLMELAYVLVWPTVNYGYYPAFTDFSGSCTLSTTTFQALVEEISHSILNAGVKKLLLLNTGISTIKPLEAVAAATHIYETN